MKAILAVLAFSIASYGQSNNRPQQVYYLSTTGSDVNPGTSASPWASPNHALNCGDVIVAQVGAYSAANFQSGHWGTVTCASNATVAWMVCASFAQCTISGGTSYGMYVDKSYWGVSGWEVTTASGGGGCFSAAPPSGAIASIHHIIFTNDIANGCGAGGFGAFSVGNFGVDYIAIAGNIAYNAAQNSANCYSGISVFQPVAADSNSGTHIYVAGNFSFGNMDPAICAGVTSTDGEGGIFDTFDWKNVGAGPYTQQAAMDNNIFVGNGGYGMEVQSYTKSLVSNPTFLRRNNTVWGNNQSTTRNSTTLCADSIVNIAYNVRDSGNIVYSTKSAACPSVNTVYAEYKYDTSSTSGSSSSGNFLFASSGGGTTQGSFNDDGGTFTYGANATGTNPAFAAPASPTLTSPSGCSAFSNVSACMGAVVSNFVPSATGTSGKGYQQPATSNGIDQANFPAFLCTAGVPIGLVSPSC